jgi:toxin ParE1/3/4
VIWIYTATKWGVDQANRYIDLLATALTELAASPEAAPSCELIRPGYRRWGVERHMIYFRVTDYGIAIVRVLHDRMDPSRHF